MLQNAGNICKKLKDFRSKNEPERNYIHFSKIQK